MAHRQLIRPNLAGEHYVRALSSAYRRFFRIDDPDFAHIEDNEAWYKIRHDAVIAHAIERREQEAAGLEWQMLPASDRPVDKRAAEIMESLLGNIKRFMHARMNLAEAIFRGSSYAFVEGERRRFTIAHDKPRKWWVPENLAHVDRWRFRLRRVDTGEPKDQMPITDGDQRIKTIWQLFNVSQNEWQNLEHPEWFVRHHYRQTEDTMGYGRGLLQAIYWFWRSKEIALTDGLKGLQRWAQGLIEVKVDNLREADTARTNDEIVSEWLDELDMMTAENHLVHDSADEFIIHDGPTQGLDKSMVIVKYFDQAIVQLILKAFLPTGGGQDKGSLARAETEQEESESASQTDRKAMAEDIQNSLVWLVWNRNLSQMQVMLADEGYDEAAAVPEFAIVQKRVEDHISNAQVIQAALQAGMPVKKIEAYEKLGLTMPTEGDDVIEPQAAGGALPELPFSDLPEESQEIVRTIYQVVTKIAGLKPGTLEAIGAHDGNGSTPATR